MLIYMISFLHPQTKERICKVIQNGVEIGTNLVLDGSNIVVPTFSFVSCLIFYFYLLHFPHNYIYSRHDGRNIVLIYFN